MIRKAFENTLRYRRQPRSLCALVGRVLLPRALVFAILGSAVLVGNVIAVDALAAPLEPSPAKVPAWSTTVAVAHPDCVPAESWPEGRPADAVVGFSFRDDAAHRLPFDRAWTLNHNASEADDVWVIGICP